MLGVGRDNYLPVQWLPACCGICPVNFSVTGSRAPIFVCEVQDTSLNLIMVFEKPALLLVCACVCARACVKLNANVPMLFTDSDMKC